MGKRLATVFLLISAVEPLVAGCSGREGIPGKSAAAAGELEMLPAWQPESQESSLLTVAVTRGWVLVNGVPIVRLECPDESALQACRIPWEALEHGLPDTLLVPPLGAFLSRYLASSGKAWAEDPEAEPPKGDSVVRIIIDPRLPADVLLRVLYMLGRVRLHASSASIIFRVTALDGGSGALPPLPSLDLQFPRFMMPMEPRPLVVVASSDEGLRVRRTDLGKMMVEEEGDPGEGGEEVWIPRRELAVSPLGGFCGGVDAGTRLVHDHLALANHLRDLEAAGQIGEGSALALQFGGTMAIWQLLVLAEASQRIGEGGTDDPCGWERAYRHQEKQRFSSVFPFVADRPPGGGARSEFNRGLATPAGTVAAKAEGPPAEETAAAAARRFDETLKRLPVGTPVRHADGGESFRQLRTERLALIDFFRDEEHSLELRAEAGVLFAVEDPYQFLPLILGFQPSDRALADRMGMRLLQRLESAGPKGEQAQEVRPLVLLLCRLSPSCRLAAQTALAARVAAVVPAEISRDQLWEALEQSIGFTNLNYLHRHASPFLLAAVEMNIETASVGLEDLVRQLIDVDPASCGRLQEILAKRTGEEESRKLSDLAASLCTNP